MRSMFEKEPVYIDIIGNCYQVESVRHVSAHAYDETGYVKAIIEAHMIDEKPSPFIIKKVHFNDPATIVFWADGTKTVVKCGEEDIYDPQTGLLMCIAKKAFGNTGKFNDILREWLPEPKTVYMSDVIDYILGDAPRVIGQYIFGEGKINA